MIKYYTLADDGFSEQTIERSRFIAHAISVTSKEEADDFFNEMRAKYKDATHNVPACIIGEKSQIQWTSDDGEPQGTSGPPVIQMLNGRKITNVAVIITRYFGGIKLGTGGLVRAYTSSAKAAVDNGGIAAVQEMDILTYELGYTYLGKLKNMAFEGDFSIKNLDYQENIIVTISTVTEKNEKIKQMMANLSGGTAKLLDETKEDEKILLSV